ncbi:hypothetical protein ACT7C9_32980 [Bacillus cereus]
MLKKHLESADEQYHSNQTDPQNNIPKSSIFLNYLSGSGLSYPFFVASGHVDAGTNGDRLWTGLTTLTSKHKWPDFPRLNGFLGLYSIYFEGINNLCGPRLNNYSYVGIIAADFPGAGLIDNIIKLNHTNPPKIVRVDPPDFLNFSKNLDIKVSDSYSLWSRKDDTNYDKNPIAIFIECKSDFVAKPPQELRFWKNGNVVGTMGIPSGLAGRKIFSFEFDFIDIYTPGVGGNFSSEFKGYVTATLYFTEPPWLSKSTSDTTFISKRISSMRAGINEIWFNPVLTPAKEFYVIGTTSLLTTFIFYNDGFQTKEVIVIVPSKWGKKGIEEIPFLVYEDEEFDEVFISTGNYNENDTLSFTGQISYTTNKFAKSVFQFPLLFGNANKTLWKSTEGELGLSALIYGVSLDGATFMFLKSGKIVNSLIISASDNQIFTHNQTPIHIPDGFDEIQVQDLGKGLHSISGQVLLDNADNFSVPNGAQYIKQNYKTSQAEIIWKAPSTSVKGDFAYFFIENTNQVPVELRFIQNNIVVYSVQKVTEETPVTITPETIPTGFDTVQVNSSNTEATGLIIGSVNLPVSSDLEDIEDEAQAENSSFLNGKSEAIFYTSKELEQITALTQKLFVFAKEDILADSVTDYQIEQVALKIDGLSIEHFSMEKYQLRCKIQQAKRLSQRRNLLQYGNFESAEPWIFSSHATILDSNDLFPHSFLTLTSTLTPNKNPTYAYQQIPKNRLKPYTRYIVRGFIAESTELDILLSCDSTLIKQQLNVPTAKIQQISIENGNCCEQADCIYVDGTVTDSHWFTYTIDTGSLQQNLDVGLELCFKLTTEKGSAQISNVEIIEERLLTEKEKQMKQRKEKKWIKQEQQKQIKIRKILDTIHKDIASLYDMKMNLKLDVSHHDIRNVHIPHANFLEGVYLSMVPDQPGPYYEEYQLLASLKRYARRVYRNRNKISNGTFQYNLLDWKPTGNVDIKIEKKHSVLQLLDSGAMVSQLVQLPIENVKGEEISYFLRIHAQGNGKVTILHGEEITVLPFTNSDEQVQMIEWYPSTNEVQLEISSKSGKVTVSSIEILEIPDIE